MPVPEARTRWFGLLVGLALCLALPAGLDAQEARAQTGQGVCARLANYTPGPRARPTDADEKLVASNALEPFLIVEQATEKKEYDDTRRFCLVTRACDVNLAMIYANGWGVARDYDAATFFLCRDREVAPGEREAMLEHVEGMRHADRPSNLLYCEHVTSGRGQLRCAYLGVADEDAALAGRVAKLKQTVPKEAAPALDALVEAIDSFADVEAGVRLIENRLGTGFAAMAVDEASGLREERVAGIERLSRARAEACPAGLLREADADLNKAYKLALTSRWPWVDIDWDAAVARLSLREAQRAWIKYRDAWTVFYQARWKGTASPDTLRREIACELTFERCVELEWLGREGPPGRVPGPQ